MNQQSGKKKKKKSQSRPPGACANYPPPTSHPAALPVLPAPAARSSPSPECGNPDSPAVVAVSMRAHPYPRSRSPCRYSAPQFPRREPPWRAPARVPEIAAPARPHRPAKHGSQNSLCRSEPRSYTKWKGTRTRKVGRSAPSASTGSPADTPLTRVSAGRTPPPRRKKTSAISDAHPAGPLPKFKE